MLTVPESCPKLALRCEPRQMGMKWRIWQEKVMLLQRILRQEEGSLCQQIYIQGREMGWPGLWQEVAEICQEVGIPDVNMTEVSSWNIKEAIFHNHLEFMKSEIKEKKKLDNIKEDDFTAVQAYFSDKCVANGRMAFKIRCQMLEDIPGNFKNKWKGREEKLQCQECNEEEILSQDHCVICPAWEDIREGLDLTDIKDLTKFFRLLLKERGERDAGRTLGQEIRPATHDS